MKTKILLKNLISFISIFALVFMTYVGHAGAALSAHTVTLSSSTPGASSVTHTIGFTNASTTAIKTVYLKYCTTAGAYAESCTAPTGLVLPGTNGVTLTGFSSNTNTASGSSNVETVTITTPGGSETVQAHTVAISGITNPNAGVFYIRVYTESAVPATLDSGTTAGATIAQVTVSGTQLETLSVTVAGYNSGNVCGEAVTATNNTATAVPFGTFTGTTSIEGAQSLQIGTNASSGYTARMEESALLTNASADTIADFGGTNDAAQGDAWSEGSSTGFGICASSGHANTTSFGTSPYYYLRITNGASKKVASYTGPVADTTTYIQYKVAVPSNQAAGVYSNYVNYYVVPQY